MSCTVCLSSRFSSHANGQQQHTAKHAKHSTHAHVNAAAHQADDSSSQLENATHTDSNKTTGATQVQPAMTRRSTRAQSIVAESTQQHQVKHKRKSSSPEQQLNHTKSKKQKQTQKTQETTATQAQSSNSKHHKKNSTSSTTDSSTATIPSSSNAATASADAAPLHVFLGGACGATTWRQTIAIPYLTSHSVTYYNPQVDEWHPHLVCIENDMKACCTILLFIIGAETRAIASMIEAAQLMASGRNVVLVIEQLKQGCTIQGEKLSENDMKDVNRGRVYLRDCAQVYRAPVFTTVQQACENIVQQITGTTTKQQQQQAEHGPTQSNAQSKRNSKQQQ